MNRFITLSLVAMMAAAPVTVFAGKLDVKDGQWKVSFNDADRTVAYSFNGKTLVSGAHVTAADPSFNTLDSKLYPRVELKKESVNDAFGKGKKYTYVYSGLPGRDNIEQTFYVYPKLPYMLVEASVVAAKGKTSSTNICPIVSETATVMPIGEGDNRVYNMPFANDNWATFHAEAWDGKPVTSCEATAFYNTDSRKGVVIGSVDHSTWKSAVHSVPTGKNSLDNLKVEAGYISDRTWDIVNNKACSERHGAVKGERVTSPRFMLGYFDDWRNGLETYGDANTVLCPKYEWDKDEALFGWQSWGGMEWGLNRKSCLSVIDFFGKELLPAGFCNKDGRCFIVLDSGWNALSDDDLRAFVTKCKELGMAAGAYTTPFSYWGGEDAIKRNDEWNGGRLGEMVLKAGGRPRHIVGWSLDPTHPAVKEWNRREFQKFKDLGFEFVKIDFMNNGSQEADSWYDPNITTGMQAYNYGMDYIKEFAGDMMLDFSIAPVFPAKAHVRRIGCDAWGDLPQSMYTLNCINGSWWLDRVYAFNDPDHMCLSKIPFSGKGSNDENEARIRYTCGLITGMTLLGGTYAYEGDTKEMYGKPFHVVGYPEERERAVRYASNKDLTEVCRLGKSFRPVEGKFNNFGTLYSQNDLSVDNEFILDTPDAFYYVVINYNTEGKPLQKTPDFARLGVDPSKFVGGKELFFGQEFNPSELKVDVPSKDVRIYRFERKGYKSEI